MRPRHCAAVVGRGTNPPHGIPMRIAPARFSASRGSVAIVDAYDDFHRSLSAAGLLLPITRLGPGE